MRHAVVWSGLTVCIFAGALGSLTSRALAADPSNYRRVALPDILPLPRVASVADVNGDGPLDVVAGGSTGLFVFPGDGSARFPNWYRATDDVFSANFIVADDFNQDGLPDLVAGGAVPNIGWNLHIFLAQQGGHYQRTFDVGADEIDSVSSPKTGDFNGDGKSDFVVGRFDSYRRWPRNSIYSRGVLQTYLGDGQGGFQGPIVSGDNGVFYGVFFTADLDGNGVADVVTVDDRDGRLSVWLGDGTGLFLSRRALLPPPSPGDIQRNYPPGPRGIAIGDLNGDGRRDLLVRFHYTGHSGNPREFSAIYFADPTDLFLAPVVLDEPRQHWRTVISQAIADVNLDGRQDIVLTSPNSFKAAGPLFGLQPATDVYLGDGSGGFTGPILSAYVGGGFSGPNGARLRDLNNDGAPDLITSGPTAGLSVATGDGAGQFGSPSFTAFFNSYWGGGTAAGDFNGDGHPDVAVASSGSRNVSVWLGDGSGGWAGPLNAVLPDGHSPVTIIAADLNNDGNQDLATGSSSFRTASPGIAILDGDGTGRFTVSRQLAAFEPVALVAADLDRDGTIDLAAASAISRRVEIFYDMPGTTRTDSVFDATLSVDNSISAYPGLAVADFDGNGFPDLVRSSPSGILNLFLNAGDPAIQQVVRVSIGGANYNVAAGDIDGNGDADLAVATYKSGATVTVLLGNGAGGFGTPVDYRLNRDQLPQSVIITDLDGLGQRAVLAPLYDSLKILVADGAGVLAAPADIPNSPMGSLVRTIAVADLNEDGIVDVALPSEVLLSRGLCGNGAADPGEQCDDGNASGCDGCSAACRIEAGAICGDGAVNTTCSEQCDDGAGNSDTQPGACRTACRLPTCGDGVQDPGEECDDGNTTSCDGCSSFCRIDSVPVCGDGVVSTCGEACDDGNQRDGDGCSASCTSEIIPGGGGRGSDCGVEWIVDNPTNRPLLDHRDRFSGFQTCVDNDPSCDFDGGVPGRCTFHVAGCIEVDDDDLSRCIPLAVERGEILRPSERQALRSPELALIRSQMTAIMQSMLRLPYDSCTAPMDLTVPLGSQLVRARVSNVARRRDTDRLLFACAP